MLNAAGRINFGEQGCNRGILFLIPRFQDPLRTNGHGFDAIWGNLGRVETLESTATQCHVQ